MTVVLGEILSTLLGDQLSTEQTKFHLNQIECLFENDHSSEFVENCVPEFK
jgi:hypothetical protein